VEQSESPKIASFNELNGHQPPISDQILFGLLDSISLKALSQMLDSAFFPDRVLNSFFVIELSF
jgi:hypothetical protein